MKPEDFQNFVSRGQKAQKAVNKILNEHSEGSMMEANFRILLQTGDFVLLQDIGPHDQYLTVTNDVENVVRGLVSSGKVQSPQRLFYLDSDLAMDEIEFNVVDGFQRFHFLSPHDEVANTCLGAWKALQKRVKGI